MSYLIASPYYVCNIREVFVNISNVSSYYKMNQYIAILADLIQLTQFSLTQF